MSGTQIFGTYRASVVETGDPQQRGRVKVRVPGVLDVELTVWAPVLGATPRSRTPALRAGDLVYVMFEAGDVDLPVVIGAPRSAI